MAIKKPSPKRKRQVNKPPKKKRWRPPPNWYPQTAKRLAKLSPTLKKLTRKRKLTANDKRTIRRVEHKIHKLQNENHIDPTKGRGVLVPISKAQLKRMSPKTKALIIDKDIQAIRQRNIAKKSRVVVTTKGDLIVRENGRWLRFIPVEHDIDSMIETAEQIFKDTRHRLVWINYILGRGNQSYDSLSKLLEAIRNLFEKYEPLWIQQGSSLENIVTGFIVYTNPPTKPKRRKQSPKRKRQAKITRGTRKKNRRH